MKIGILQDIHANLPALKKSIQFFQEQGCSKIFHVGDLIGIGPYPKETLQLALSIPEMEFIMGNHDFWYGMGLPNPQPVWMSDEEVLHQKWTHTQIGPAYKATVAKWPFSIDLDITPKQKIRFQHYGLNEKGTWFKRHIKQPTEQDLNQLFGGVEADMIFYGHNHLANNTKGRSHYINMGSTGCFNEAIARVGIVKTNKGGPLVYESHHLSYSDDGLMEAFDEREVPARTFITSTFITR